MSNPNTQLGVGTTPETVAVIGSGIAGSLTAEGLAQAGYDVTVIEERPEFFNAASANAAHAHMGGLYSGNLQTAQQCLLSAIDAKKTTPYILTEQKTAFLVAEESEMSLPEFTDFYSDLREFYGSLPQHDQVFGDPEKFFRMLRPEEYAFAKNIAGGIMTQEVNLDMPRARATLFENIQALGGTILTGASVKEARQRNGYFDLTVEKDSQRQVLAFDQVVNAGGHKTRLLDHQLGDQTQYNLFLKTWNIVRNIGQPLPPFFIVRGDFMMHIPKPRQAGQEPLSVMNATDSGSYIDSLVYGADDPQLPQEWEDILRTGTVPNEAQRQAKILSYAAESFIVDASTIEPVRMVPGVATSFSGSRQNRTQRGATMVQPGWQSIVPTKATHGLELAEQAVANSLEHSGINDETAA